MCWHATYFWLKNCSLLLSFSYQCRSFCNHTSTRTLTKKKKEINYSIYWLLWTVKFLTVMCSIFFSFFFLYIFCKRNVFFLFQFQWNYRNFLVHGRVSRVFISLDLLCALVQLLQGHLSLFFRASYFLLTGKTWKLTLYNLSSEHLLIFIFLYWDVFCGLTFTTDSSHHYW